MTQREMSEATGVPLPARVFLRCGGAKLFGGFVVAVHEDVEDEDVDEIWEVEIVFKRKLAKGRCAIGLRLDQVMTGPFLSTPSALES